MKNRQLTSWSKTRTMTRALVFIAWVQLKVPDRGLRQENIEKRETI